ncbi:hypothetical protein, partial [Xanthomonas fragariae]|uniref:hypothetical protein n=1 Tax=Xanthomonas fragariae TaxID=48664 RepID=UPI001F37DB46
QDREDVFETLPAHVARIGFLAHPQSLHQSGKIVNRFSAVRVQGRGKHYGSASALSCGQQISSWHAP